MPLLYHGCTCCKHPLSTDLCISPIHHSCICGMNGNTSRCRAKISHSCICPSTPCLSRFHLCICDRTKKTTLCLSKDFHFCICTSSHKFRDSCRAVRDHICSCLLGRFDSCLSVRHDCCCYHYGSSNCKISENTSHNCLCSSDFLPSTCKYIEGEHDCVCNSYGAEKCRCRDKNHRPAI